MLSSWRTSLRTAQGEVSPDELSQTPVVLQAEARRKAAQWVARARPLPVWGCPALGSHATSSACLLCDRGRGLLLSEPRSSHPQNGSTHGRASCGGAIGGNTAPWGMAVAMGCPPVWKRLTRSDRGIGGPAGCLRPMSAYRRQAQGQRWYRLRVQASARGPGPLPCQVPCRPWGLFLLPMQPRGELVSLLFHSSNDQPLCARRGAGPCPWGLMVQDEFPGPAVAA